MVWRLAIKPFPLQLVPYQAGHSGPPVDTALGIHTKREVTDRGRWQSQSSSSEVREKREIDSTPQPAPDRKARLGGLVLCPRHRRRYAVASDARHEVSERGGFLMDLSGM